MSSPVKRLEIWCRTSEKLDHTPRMVRAYRQILSKFYDLQEEIDTDSWSVENELLYKQICDVIKILADAHYPESK